MLNRGRAAIVLAACGLLVFAGLAIGAKLSNGNFEQGSFKGWTHQREGGEDGNWFVYKGSPDISTFFAPDRGISSIPRLPEPRQGKYAAATAQEGPGTHLLFRTLRLKAGHKNKVSFLFRWHNYADDFASPHTLHAGSGSVTRGSSDTVDNQQFRIDVMRKGADAYSLNGQDVLENLIAAKPGAKLKTGWKRYHFNLSSLGGGKVKLRVAEVDNQDVQIIAIDDLKLTSKPKHHPH